MKRFVSVFVDRLKRFFGGADDQSATIEEKAPLRLLPWTAKMFPGYLRGRQNKRAAARLKLRVRRLRQQMKRKLGRRLTADEMQAAQMLTATQ